MSIGNESDERSAIRLLAIWLLLEGSERAFSMSSRTPGDSAQAEGGQSAGWPPAPGPRPPATGGHQHQRIEAIKELATLLRRECSQRATAEETRRIAELLEYLDRDEEALTWWKKAASKGDDDARDYLDILRTEAEGGNRMNSDPPGDQEKKSDFLAAFVQKANGTVAGLDTFAAVQIALNSAIGPEVSEAAKQLVGEIEKYLTHPDRMTDGRRR